MIDTSYPEGQPPPTVTFSDIAGSPVAAIQSLAGQPYLPAGQLPLSAFGPNWLQSLKDFANQYHITDIPAAKSFFETAPAEQRQAVYESTLTASAQDVVNHAAIETEAQRTSHFSDLNEFKTTGIPLIAAATAAFGGPALAASGALAPLGNAASAAASGVEDAVSSLGSAAAAAVAAIKNAVNNLVTSIPTSLPSIPSVPGIPNFSAEQLAPLLAALKPAAPVQQPTPPAPAALPQTSLGIYGYLPYVAIGSGVLLLYFWKKKR